MVGSSDYIPERGDIVWLDFNPQRGHEQRGRRPEMVVSHRSYNEKVGLALFCPVTKKEKGYPFEVPVDGIKVLGADLSDQVKSLDWRIRAVEFIEKMSGERTEEVVQKLIVMIS